jgi:hypothetical protein
VPGDLSDPTGCRHADPIPPVKPRNSRLRSVEWLLLSCAPQEINMDPSMFLGFMAITLVGLVTLGLVLKFLEPPNTVRQARSADVGDPAVQSVAVLPAFFATLPAGDQPRTAVGFDDELVAFLEQHVKNERAMATKFVHYPSIDALYRPAQPSARMN